jgi:hypothetical protein
MTAVLTDQQLQFHSGRAAEIRAAKAFQDSRPIVSWLFGLSVQTWDKPGVVHMPALTFDLPDGAAKTSHAAIAALAKQFLAVAQADAAEQTKAAASQQAAAVQQQLDQSRKELATANAELSDALHSAGKAGKDPAAQATAVLAIGAANSRVIKLAEEEVRLADELASVIRLARDKSQRLQSNPLAVVTDARSAERRRLKEILEPVAKEFAAETEQMRRALTAKLQDLVAPLLPELIVLHGREKAAGESARPMIDQLLNGGDLKEDFLRFELPIVGAGR